MNSLYLVLLIKLRMYANARQNNGCKRSKTHTYTEKSKVRTCIWSLTMQIQIIMGPHL